MGNRKNLGDRQPWRDGSHVPRNPLRTTLLLTHDSCKGPGPSRNSSLAIPTNKVLFSSEIRYKKKKNIYRRGRNPFKMMYTPIRMGCIFKKYSKYALFTNSYHRNKTFCPLDGRVIAAVNFHTNI